VIVLLVILVILLSIFVPYVKLREDAADELCE
jgi:hypothetical protein